MTHYQRRKTHEKETTKGTADPCRHTAYIFYSSALPFFYGICRNQIHLSCNRRTAERNLELFSGYYGITVDHYYFCSDVISAVMPVRLAHWEMLCMSLPRLSVRNALEKKKKHGYPEDGYTDCRSKICTPCVLASFLHDRILF